MRDTLIHLGVFGLTLGLAWTAPTMAQACGGFFCDNTTPVVQTAERVLFRINDDNTTTVIVEVQYQGPPSDFGWIVPVAEGISAEDLGTAPPGLFDALEERTAPIFERQVSHGGGIDDEGFGLRDCSPRNIIKRRRDRKNADGTDLPPPPDTSGVAVVGAAVVGPYAVELITAEAGDNLSNWLLLNGYQISQDAIPAMDYYIDRQMAFIGLKMNADVPAGPIDAFSFTVPGTTPSLPLVLTSIAAAPEMELIVYVAGAGRHVPGNGEDLDFDYGSVSFTSEEETDYLDVLRNALGAGNINGRQSWNTEFASILGERVDIQDSPIDELLDRDDYLNRYHSFMSSHEMSYDPYWQPDANAPDVDNRHELYDYGNYLDTDSDSGSSWGSSSSSGSGSTTGSGSTSGSTTGSGSTSGSGTGGSSTASLLFVLMPLLVALPRRRRTLV